MLIWVSAVMGTTVETDGLRLGPPLRCSLGLWRGAAIHPGPSQHVAPAAPRDAVLQGQSAAQSRESSTGHAYQQVSEGAKTAVTDSGTSQVTGDPPAGSCPGKLK